MFTLTRHISLCPCAFCFLLAALHPWRIWDISNSFKLSVVDPESFHWKIYPFCYILLVLPECLSLLSWLWSLPSFDLVNQALAPTLSFIVEPCACLWSLTHPNPIATTCSFAVSLIPTQIPSSQCDSNLIHPYMSIILYKTLSPNSAMTLLNS